MKLIGLMTVRNEAAFVGLSARVALRWCDGLVILDHASTDATPGILARIAGEFPGRVTLIHEPEPTWQEMNHRQRTLDAARELGATHCAIIDADEVLAANMLDWIRVEVSALEPGQILQIPMRNMWRSLDRYRCDRSPFGNMAITTVAFAVSPETAWFDQTGYPHHHREPYDVRGARRYYWQQIDGGVMHLQFANWRRLVAKQSWYQAMEAVRFPWKLKTEIAATYSQAMNEAGLETAPANASWWAGYSDIMHHLNLDIEPWHEREIAQMFADHGAAFFDGLNMGYRPA